MFGGLFVVRVVFLFAGWLNNVSIIEAFTIAPSWMEPLSLWNSGPFHPRMSRRRRRDRDRQQEDGSVVLFDRSNSDNSSNEEELEELLVFAKELADVAGDVIRPYWRLRGDDGDESLLSLQVEEKEEEGRSLAQTVSPVTIADRAAERAMRDLIEDRYPTHGIVGEEYGSIRMNSSDFVWVLDPIDGTKAFITGKPTFGTLIGLLYQGTPILGIIDQPISKERWIGAMDNPTTFNGQPVSVTNHQSSSSSLLEDATVYTTTPDMFRVGDEMDKFEMVRDRSYRTLYGCDCYAYALLASGWNVQVVIEADLGLYDYCALVPIVQGAGGIITDWNGHALTLSNHNDSQGRVLATSNLRLHQQIITLLSTPLLPNNKNNKNKIRNYLITLLLGITIGTNLPLRLFS